MFFVILIASSITLAAPQKLRLNLHHSMAQCVQDGNTFYIPDTQAGEVATMDDITVQGRWITSSDIPGAVLDFRRGEKLLLQTKMDSFMNPNGTVVISSDRHWLAVTYSDGGAIGSFHTLIFHAESDGSIRDLSSSMRSVISDFSHRHNCETRGNNYQAFYWQDKDRLILTASVYDTGDCKELGYTEGYLLNPSSGKIVHRYSEHELLRLDGICTFNYYSAD